MWLDSWWHREEARPVLVAVRQPTWWPNVGETGRLDLWPRPALHLALDEACAEQPRPWSLQLEDHGFPRTGHRCCEHGHELDTNHCSTTSPITLASSPSKLKASSALDMWHIPRQAPQDYTEEKLPKLKSVTSTSYYDFDTGYEIPFCETHDPEEYLKWDCKMDTYLKLCQVRFEDQVKCTTRNFHEYALTWWLHTPSKTFDMSWYKMKKAMRREFVPSTYTKHIQRQLENTIQGSKSLDVYFM
ncbi:gag-pol polyprotein [Hordeum vulgare]|nr:gag-pol polyprotein [Hordeum vulgare]